MPKNKSLKVSWFNLIFPFPRMNYSKSYIAKFIEIAEKDPDRIILKDLDIFTKFVLGKSNARS